jgi:hypothetical protein
MRNDECDVLSGTDRHPHDVADAQFEIARIVGKRKIEARGPYCGERVDAAN